MLAALLAACRRAHKRCPHRPRPHRNRRSSCALRRCCSHRAATSSRAAADRRARRRNPRAPDLETVAEGNAEFRRGGVVIRADRLTYEHADDLARASGNVRVSKDGNTYSGPELQLHVSQFEGFFLKPSYYFARTGAGGTRRALRLPRFASRARDRRHLHELPGRRPRQPGVAAVDRAREARLRSQRRHRRRRRAALLRRADPRRAGVELSAQRCTQVGLAAAEPEHRQQERRRGAGAVLLEHRAEPRCDAHAVDHHAARRRRSTPSSAIWTRASAARSISKVLPHDRLAGRSRHAVDFRHEGIALAIGIDYQARIIRVSDDEYWKDFPRRCRA